MLATFAAPPTSLELLFATDQVPGDGARDGGYHNGHCRGDADNVAVLRPGGDGPAFLTGALGRDANDLDVTAAIASCSDQLASSSATGSWRRR